MGIIYFLIYLFLEIMFSYEFAKIFTPFGFFLEVIISAVAGIYIIRLLPFSLNESMMKVLKKEITQEEFLSIGLFKFVGALLLIIPGVFSDILGILFLFEPFARWVARKFLPGKDIYTYTNAQNEDEIIDVEIIEEISDKKTP